MNIKIAIIIAIISVIGYIAFENYSLKRQNEKLLQNEAVYKNQVQEFSSALEAKDKVLALCDERTKQLKTESDKKAQEIEKARTEVRQKTKKRQESAENLLRDRKPDADECVASKKLFKDYLEFRKNEDKIDNTK